MDSLTVDEIYEKVGSFGLYQYRLLALMGFMKIFGGTFQIIIMTFLAAEPKWKCASAANSTVCNVTGAITRGNSHYNLRCSLSRGDWEFDTTGFSSIVSEWDLVCDRAYLRNLSKIIVYVGYMIGALFGGILSDKFGRKQMLYFPAVLCNVLALVASFMTDFWVFITLRAIIGVCIGSSSLSMYVLLVENVGVKHRALAGTSIWYFTTLGWMLMPLFGYLIKDWRDLSIAAAVPGLIQISFWWFLPESSHWYMVNNREEQARDVLSDVARLNNEEMPPNPIHVNIKKQRLGDVRDLFRSRRAIHITLVNWFLWYVNSAVFYFVVVSSELFGVNRFLEFFLQSIIELPSHFAAIILMNKLGRKKTVLIGLILSVIVLTVAFLLQGNLPANIDFVVGNIILFMIAKFFINMSYVTVYIISAELFPTVIRNVGMGTSSAVARIGSIAAPYVVKLDGIQGFFAVCAFLACLACLTLPETLNAPTQERLEEKPPKDPAYFDNQPLDETPM